MNKQPIDCYVHYDTYDFNYEHPTLVLQDDDFGSVGYDIDKSGNLTRVCICSAKYSNECVCGGFKEYE